MYEFRDEFRIVAVRILKMTLRDTVVRLKEDDLSSSTCQGIRKSSYVSFIIL